MASKYVALKDGEGFQAGDDVTVAQAGDSADQLLADGVIAERAEPEAPAARGDLTPDQAAAGRPRVTGQGSGSFVTLGNSDADGIPQTTRVTVNQQPQQQQG